MVIGKKGAEIDALRKKLKKIANGPVSVDVVEVKRRARRKPHCSVRCRAARRPRCIPSRYAQGRSSLPARAGAKGIRIQCSGRLGGAEMSRREWYREGRVPLHTLRAKIDYGFATAATTMGSLRRAGLGVPGREAAGPECSAARARGFFPSSFPS